jgi:hypothetical protein
VISQIMNRVETPVSRNSWSRKGKNWGREFKGAERLATKAFSLLILSSKI